MEESVVLEVVVLAQAVAVTAIAAAASAAKIFLIFILVSPCLSIFYVVVRFWTLALYGF